MGVWKWLTIFKHMFILWLIMKQRLPTRLSLSNWGISPNKDYCLCGNWEETHVHLFFECTANTKCMHKIMRWLGLQRPVQNVYIIMKWVQKDCKHSMFRRKVYLAAIVATYYVIWKNRNTALWEGKSTDVDTMVKFIQQTIKNMIVQILSKKVKIVDIN